MLNRKIEDAPQFYGRLCGLLYLVNIACGAFGQAFVRARMWVPGDPAATTHHILASEALFRLSIAGDLIMHVTDLPTTLIIYFLLRPVSRDLSLLAALFSMVQTAALVANKLNLVTVLFLLKQSGSLTDFTAGQREGLAQLALSQHDYGFAIGLVFFGFSCLLVGGLMFRSEYFPRALGVLQVLAGLAYLLNSFVLLLFPSFADRASFVLLISFIGELTTALWLAAKGVRVEAWDRMMLKRG